MNVCPLSYHLFFLQMHGSYKISPKLHGSCKIFPLKNATKKNMEFNTTIQTSHKSKTQQRKTHTHTSKNKKNKPPMNKSSQERNPPMLPRTWLCRSTPCHKLRKSLKETLKSGVAARRHLGWLRLDETRRCCWERHRNLL